MKSFRMDGSPVNGASQLFELVEVLSNPEVYAAKVKALEDAAAKNQKFVELVGPADQIAKLREKAQADADKAAEVLEKATKEASELGQAARDQAAGLIAAAKAKADAMISDAAAAKSAADAIIADASAKLQDAQNAQKKVDDAYKAIDGLQAQLASRIAATEASKADYEAAKASIIAKHEQFLKNMG
jgi:hypothetical protein